MRCRDPKAARSASEGILNGLRACERPESAESVTYLRDGHRIASSCRKRLCNLLASLLDTLAA